LDARSRSAQAHPGNYRKGVGVDDQSIGLAEAQEQVLQYVQAGAAGYVLQDESLEDLLERVRDAHAGRVRVSPKIAAALMSRVAEYALLLDQVELGSYPVELTPREEEILAIIGQGLTNQEIADRLRIEVGTVKNHVHSILQKLDVNSRHEAAVAWTILHRGERVRSKILN
jgi:two-component system, NarL family, nitrate/nitrite response regulator NarL